MTMNRIPESDCAVMCSLITTYKHAHIFCLLCRVSSMVFVKDIINPRTGGSVRVADSEKTEPDCAIRWNLINTHTNT